MPKFPKVILPRRIEYKQASAFDVSLAGERARLWFERLRRDREMLGIVPRRDERHQLMAYIDGSYPQIESGRQVYLNEALPAIEDLILGTAPGIPPSSVTPRHAGQEAMAELCKGLLDQTFANPLTRTYRAIIGTEWDELTWGIGILKVWWQSKVQESDYRPTVNPRRVQEEMAEAQAENAQPATARATPDDDHALHIRLHEEALLGLPDGAQEAAFLGQHMREHYGQAVARNVSGPVFDRVDPERFLYDADAECWEERRHEAELSDELVADLERIPGIRNLNPENCPSTDEFNNDATPPTEEEQKAGASHFDFEATRVKVWKIHDRANGGYVLLPFTQKEGTKPLLETDWPYGQTDTYHAVVHRPIAGRVHGLCTLGLIRPILRLLAEVNWIIRRHVQKAACYKKICPDMNQRQVSDLLNPDLDVATKFDPASLALMQEFKPPSLPQETLMVRDLLLSELRRMLGSDIMQQGGDTPHRVTATESALRGQYRDSRMSRRQAQLSEVLSRSAQTILRMYRDLWGTDAIPVRALGPMGVELQKLVPSDIPAELTVDLDLSFVHPLKQAQDVAAFQQFVAMITALAPGTFDPVELTIAAGQLLGVPSPGRFFRRPGQVPVVQPIGGGGGNTGIISQMTGNPAQKATGLENRDVQAELKAGT